MFGHRKQGASLARDITGDLRRKFGEKQEEVRRLQEEKAALEKTVEQMRNASGRMTEGDNCAALTVDLVIKLGGAAITDKSSVETLRSEMLQQGAALIKQCHGAGHTVAVVHGAGSFGHHLAKLYKVNDGLYREKDYHGFCATRNSVTTLNKLVVDCLTDHGLPAVACPAFPGWQTSGRAVNRWPSEAVKSVLSAGLVPVFHGDCVLDTQQDCCILSGDTIIKTLCNNFSVKRVVFLTDVPGVFDKPPSEPGSNLLQRVHIAADGQIHDDVKTSASSHDVTGEMLTKLRCAQDIVASPHGQTQVFIAEIGSSDSARLCLDEHIDITKLKATEIVIDRSK